MDEAWEEARELIAEDAARKKPIRRFDFRDLELETLPEELLTLTELETVVCPRGLSVLPKWLGAFAHLKRLEFTNSVPSEELLRLPALTHLSLRESPAESLPEWIGGLHRLIALTVLNSPLVSVPGSIGELGHLEILSLENNHLTSLPDGLRRMTSLRHLDVSRNKFEAWPEPIEGLTGLESLTVDFLEAPDAKVVPRTRATVHLAPEGEDDEDAWFPDSYGSLRTFAKREVDARRLINLLSRLNPLEQLTDLYLTCP